MSLLSITALVLYTFGAYVYGAMALSLLRPASRPSVGCDLAAPRADGRPTTVIVLVSFAWFVVLGLLILLSLIPGVRSWPLQFVRLVIVFLFPPLIMHITYHEARTRGAGLRHPAWKGTLVAVYAVSQLFSLTCILGFLELLGLPRRTFGPIAGLGLAALFSTTGVYCMLALTRTRASKESPLERSSRRSTLALYGLVILLVALSVVAGIFGRTLNHLVELAASCLPLMFLVVAVYHEDRFEFFDLFIKRGLALLATFALLTAFFGVVLPVLQRLELNGARPWVFAFLLLPVAMSLPWLYRKLGRALDRVWLGRGFTPVEAVKRFLSGLQSATSEHELVARAEQGLSTIFRAPTRVVLEPAAPPGGFERALELPLRSAGGRTGAILMGRRANHAPYFSEDTALLGSLADVLSYMLENVRLQERKAEQERREKALSLHASRSELKALRAQINPHFLFNALNAIAGLIHRDPQRADLTVEQLADVFRYTLRSSDKEWALLEDEIDFVRAYLDVEQARFGDRLRVGVELEDGARGLRIPTMMIQTLVENAIKHGVAAVRGKGRVEVDARRVDGRLRVEVADNGPGPAPASAPRAPARPGGRGVGYGLRNIRERLRGYYGDGAGLTVARDDGRGMTVARIVLPLPDGASAALADTRSTAAARAEASDAPASADPRPATVTPAGTTGSGPGSGR